MVAQVGSKAPDFTLQNQSGQSVTLSQFQGQHHVVLFFFPKSFTPGCTREVCQFRDQYEIFQQSGAVVIGISNDSVETQQQFTTERQVPFILLSDPDAHVRKAYGVASTLGGLLGDLLPGRETFVIDKTGIICHRFRSQLNPDAHIKNALDVLKQLPS